MTDPESGVLGLLNVNLFAGKLKTENHWVRYGRGLPDEAETSAAVAVAGSPTCGIGVVVYFRVAPSFSPPKIPERASLTQAASNRVAPGNASGPPVQEKMIYATIGIVGTNCSRRRKTARAGNQSNNSIIVVKINAAGNPDSKATCRKLL